MLAVLVAVITFSGSVAQDHNANKHAQTRQTPMGCSCPPFHRKQTSRASKRAKITRCPLHRRGRLSQTRDRR